MTNIYISEQKQKLEIWNWDLVGGVEECKYNYRTESVDVKSKLEK